MRVTAKSTLVPQSAPLATAADLLDAFAEFLHIDVGAGDAAKDTLITYRRQLQFFLQWCDGKQIQPAAVALRDVKRYRHWLAEQQFKPATIALKLAVVRRFYQAALEQGLVNYNPALGVSPPREKRDPATRITYLERAEVQTLLTTIDDDGSLKASRDRALIGIMALEGPRTVELHRANIADISRQGRNRGIRVEGKRNIRIVPLTPQLADALDHYLEQRTGLMDEELSPQSPLFIALGNRAGGKRLSRRGMRSIIDHYLKASNLKAVQGRIISAHSLRHTAGTLALRGGADLRQVQDLLGHADPRTTCIYAHVADRWENNPALKLDINV
ncbi:MAG: tyrosine-type recombinase/integrase [Cyanobacteria bacterium P01_H01_bin.15]